MKPQRVYIATAAVNAPAARDLATRLRIAGHDVVSTWHDEEGIERRRLDESLLLPSHQRSIARRCVLEVLASTVVVALAHPDMRGALVEVGVAIGAMIPVDWRGEAPTLFAHYSADPPVLDGA